MSVPTATQARLESLIQSDRVVLFMKGDRRQPQCGFSAATIGILDSMQSDYTTVDVLSDPEVREGIKTFSDWPTIPQLYVDQEFVGGCDIVREMYNAGELHEVFGLEAPDRSAPAITITDAAAELIRGAMDDQPDLCIHLSIDEEWNHQFSLGPAAGHEIVATANNLKFLVDLQTAPRANGLSIDLAETPQGPNLSVSNPNMPAGINQLAAEDLKRWIDEGRSFQLIDVRTEQEVATAALPQARTFDEPYFNELQTLPRDTPLVFLCHHGTRSQAAAEQFVQLGFTDIHNLAGGIDAWSRNVDASVPVY
ncbi:MAG: Grx4 family monothiol glutaredoxin [Gammaproteobacteria bacterium]|nr:Grx4 family monothiol glutaredoxin [Gammaproteobacteria bacterium]